MNKTSYMLMPFFALPNMAYAHDVINHANMDAGLLHYLSSPDHLLVLLGIGMWCLVLLGIGLWFAVGGARFLATSYRTLFASSHDDRSLIDQKRSLP